MHPVHVTGAAEDVLDHAVADRDAVPLAGCGRHPVPVLVHHVDRAVAAGVDVAGDDDAGVPGAAVVVGDHVAGLGSGVVRQGVAAQHETPGVDRVEGRLEVVGLVLAVSAVVRGQAPALDRVAHRQLGALPFVAAPARRAVVAVAVAADLHAGDLLVEQAVAAAVAGAATVVPVARRRCGQRPEGDDRVPRSRGGGRRLGVRVGVGVGGGDVDGRRRAQVRRGQRDTSGEPSGDVRLGVLRAHDPDPPARLDDPLHSAEFGGSVRLVPDLTGHLLPEQRRDRTGGRSAADRPPAGSAARSGDREVGRGQLLAERHGCDREEAERSPGLGRRGLHRVPGPGGEGRADRHVGVDDREGDSVDGHGVARRRAHGMARRRGHGTDGRHRAGGPRGMGCGRHPQRDG